MKKLLLILFLSPFFLAAQDEEGGESKFCKEIDSKEALKLYEKAIDKKKYKKPERMEFLRKCLELEPDFAEANLFMGFEIIVHCKLENKPFAPASPYFMKAISVCPDIHSEPYYYLGFDFYERYMNDSAIKYLDKFVKFKSDNEKKFGKEYEGELYQAKEMIKSAKKEKALKDKPPVPFDPKVVLGVSTPRDEYLAYISPDDKNCYFVRRVQVQDKNKVYASDKEKEMFMLAVRDNTGKFNIGEPMPYPFNEGDDNQGGCTISIDNKHLYFAMMRQEGGAQPNCDIYYSVNIDDEWKPIRKLSVAVNHPIYWDSQPTVSADNNSIIFASDRPGGFGGIDLYITTKDPVTNLWGPPQNLGPKINTAGDEKTPFIHSDSETLYFSSNGHYGFGGYDIFFVRKNDKGEWGDPENIGSPINSGSDNTGFFVSGDAKTGYFFSFDEGKVRGKGVGRYDLYSFDLYPAARPNEVALLGIETKDSFGNPITGAKAELTNLKTKEKTLAVIDTLSGKGVVAVSLKRKDDPYILTLKKEGHAFASSIVNVKAASFKAPPPPVQLVTDSVRVGSSFVINNIYYNTNSAELKDESKAVLNAFADYLKANPKLVIEIQGHTDNVGNASANQALSANRAFTVKAILESFGIKGDRIKAKGFGSSKPLGDNSSEEGRAKNRRTEFMILSND
jgi:outer membrane protein OmpA-like peptidoglycan-associated protein